MGANVAGRQAMSGHIELVSLQVKGSPGDIRPHLATARPCMACKREKKPNMPLPWADDLRSVYEAGLQQADYPAASKELSL